VLLGGEGDDLLIGSRGRDLLVGGIGSALREDEPTSAEAVALADEDERDWLGVSQEDERGTASAELTDQAVLGCAIVAALDGAW
jgi:hypothetical protein